MCGYMFPVTFIDNEAKGDDVVVCFFAFSVAVIPHWAHVERTYVDLLTAFVPTQSLKDGQKLIAIVSRGQRRLP